MTDTAAGAPSLAAIVGAARVVVCCGTGGVGKTTTAAALALLAARSGRRVVVVTIDPARRLADALGLGELTNEPRRVSLDGVAGTLDALMLDPKTTFDDLVVRYAKDPDQAERILANRFYANVSEGLSGTQEYMAMEKLYELHESGRFDLIVIDTPPTRNALGFLDAPRLLNRMLDNRLYRVLITPTRGIVRAVNAAAHAVVHQLTRVVGGEVVDDAIAFFRAFEGMEKGFDERAASVGALLHSPETAFVLVASPRRDTAVEAEHFARQLRDDAIAVRALVINRATPDFGDAAVDADRDDPAARALADFRAAAAAERTLVEELRNDVRPDAVVVVPLLGDDVHDVTGLGAIADLLCAEDR